MDHGDGIKVWDIDGNEYYDFLAGIAVNCLGHNNPKLVKAIQNQAEKLIHISSIYYNEPATVYAKNMPKGFKKVEYGNLESIKEAITAETAAIIIEPIQGEGGVNVPSKEFFKGLESLCKEKGILLIVDEVQSGFGRAGSLFAHELFDIKPDIMTMAKGIGGGVPMGGILATEEVATGFVPGDHGTTFAGGPLVAAAANVVFDKLTSEGFLDNVNEVGNYFKDELIKLQEKYDLIAEVRGKGLIVGVELTQPGGEFVDKFREKGFLINCTAGNVLRFVPPLIASKEDIDKLIVAFDELLSS